MIRSFSKFIFIPLALSMSFAVEPALTIDTIPISVKEFNLLQNQFMNNYRSYLTFQNDTIEQLEMKEIKKAVIEELVETALTNKYTKENNITVNDTEVQEKIEQIKQGFPDPKSFWKTLKEQKITLDDLSAGLRKELLKTKITNTLTSSTDSVSAEEIKEHYAKNSIGEPPRKYNVTLIVTSNKAYLQSVLHNQNINWAKINVNKELSKYKEDISIEELPESVGDLLNMLVPHNFSPIIDYDENNLCSIKLHSSRMDINAVPELIKNAMITEKKNTAYKSWLKKQLSSCKIVLNAKMFPPEDFSVSNIFSSQNDNDYKLEPLEQ